MIGGADRVNIEGQLIQYGGDRLRKIVGFSNRQLALFDQPTAVRKIS